MTKKAVVWIREDFRIEDNEALAIASQNHEFVSALYIYNPKNFDKKREAQKWWLSKALENFNPDIVGFTAVSSQFSFIKDLCDIVKKQFPKIITVVGGVHPTLDPACVMESKYLDVV